MNTPFYGKYGWRVKAEAASVPNLLPQPITSQSVQMSGKKTGPQLKGHTHQLFQLQVLWFNVKNGPIPGSLPSTGKETEALPVPGCTGPARGPCGRLARRRAVCAVQMAMGPETQSAHRTANQGCAARALPCGADRRLEDSAERELLYGLGPKWELSGHCQHNSI